MGLEFSFTNCSPMMAQIYCKIALPVLWLLWGVLYLLSAHAGCSLGSGYVGKRSPTLSIALPWMLSCSSSVSCSRKTPQNQSQFRRDKWPLASGTWRTRKGRCLLVLPGFVALGLGERSWEVAGSFPIARVGSCRGLRLRDPAGCRGFLGGLPRRTQGRRYIHLIYKKKKLFIILLRK